MQKTRKRGFTIVELVIVIAIIAILAAVLIPTFANVIQKAQTAGDIQLVHNINTILAADATVDGTHMTAFDAIEAVEEGGYKLDKLTPTSEGRLILWDSTQDRFVLVEEDGTEIFPKDGKTSAEKVDLFQISESYDASAGYSVYLSGEVTGELAITTGVDAGHNTGITAITYSGSDEVTIRTNGDLCVLTVSSGTVHHYGMGLYDVGNEHDCHAELHDKTLYESAVDVTADFAGGKGTEEAPYLIATPEQFMNIEKLSAAMETNGEPQYIKLVADVETNTAINTMFCGEFDGDGHTITFKPDNWNWPGLFQGTMNGGETVFKNFTYVCEGAVAPIAYSAGYNYTGTGVVFENITAKPANPGEVLPLLYNQTSPFLCNTYQGNVTFRNCVNEISFSTTGAYNGIFIGNYAAANWHQNADGSYAYPTVVFENCVNKGTVSGVNVGFFTGNDTAMAGPAKLVNSADYVNKYSDGKSIAYYISGCRNDGTIIGTKTASALNTMVKGENATSTSNIAINTALTEAQFHSGMMFVATTTDMSLSLNNNVVSINPSANTDVDSYVLQIVMYGHKITEDAPQFIIHYDIPVASVGTTTFKYISQIAIDHQYVTANNTTFDALVAQYGVKETVQFQYVEVPNADGSITLVVHPNSGSTGYYYSGTPDYNLYAQSHGATIGSVQYRHGEI